MIHIRRQIRQAIADKFSADVPGTFKRVEAGRVHALDFKTMLPCLEVEFAGEEVQARSMRGQGKIRSLRFVVRITAKGIDLQDSLDDLALIVEARLGADITLGGIVMHLHHLSTDFDASADGESRIGNLALTYAALVTTPEDNAAVRA